MLKSSFRTPLSGRGDCDHHEVMGEGQIEGGVHSMHNVQVLPIYLT